MTYDQLSTEQKSAVQALVNFVRSLAMELAKVGNHGRATASSWSGNIETIVNSLDDGQVIPSTVNLAGAQGLTKAELINLVGYAITISETGDNASGSYNTNYHRGLYAKAVGTVNLIG